MITVVEAEPSQIDALIELEAALFVEDAGRHDPFSDPTWPRREGRKDFEDLISSRTASCSLRAAGTTSSGCSPATQRSRHQHANPWSTQCFARCTSPRTPVARVSL